MNNKKSQKAVYLIAASALCTAMIAVMTAFVKINTGINEGYLHFGDSMIYLTACALPLPYAVLSAAIGGAFADILAGSALWAPATAIIKALVSLPFAVVYSFKITKNPNKLLNKATAPMPVVSGVITVCGYYFAEGIMYSFASAWTSVPFSIIQAVGSAVIYYIAAAALDKINFKQRIIFK